MAVEKITISLPAELVGEIDRLSDEGGVSRSAFVREATAQYVLEKHTATEADRHRHAADDLLDVLASLREREPLDARPTLEILRELRGPLDDAAVSS
jgi:Arc/MetJ-type ribon-helix-helix transcriptional regulator